MSQVWTHFGPGPARYWARRMAHETAVHRADGADRRRASGRGSTR